MKSLVRAGFICLSIALMLLSSCATFENEKETSIVEKVGLNLSVEAKSFNEDDILEEIQVIRKRSSKNKSLVAEKNQLMEVRDGIYAFDDRLETEFSEYIPQEIEKCFTDAGYEYGSEFDSRYVLEAQMNILHGQVEEGIMASYDLFFNLVDNKNLPIDLSRTADDVKASHTEFSNVTDISTSAPYVSRTWRTNGTVTCDNMDSVVAQIKDALFTEIHNNMASIIF